MKIRLMFIEHSRLKDHLLLNLHVLRIHKNKSEQSNLYKTNRRQQVKEFARKV